MPLDNEFLELVNQYMPKQELEKVDEIPYEEAQLQNAKDMIIKFEQLKHDANPEETDLIKYYERVIAGYQKKIDEGVKTYTKDEMVDIINNLKKNCKDFDLLPIPTSYLKEIAQENDEAKNELERIKLMEAQRATKDPKVRLENYKSYLLEKLDKKKLDKKLKSNP